MNLSVEQIKLIQSWMEEAGQIAMEGFGSAAAHWKPDHSPVTDNEYRIETLLIDRLGQHFPDMPVISEERAVPEQQSSNKGIWVLDPIDGTKAYLNGLSTWGISLGLMSKGELAAGFFYQPATNSMIWSAGTGAFWNGQPLSAGASTLYDSPTAFLAVPSNTHLHYRITYPRLQAYGSTALHLACLARGVAVGALTRRIYIWDIAGLLPVLNQTGIAYEYLSGASVDLKALLSGQRTPEPILAARPEWIQRLRASIEKVS